MNLLVLIALLPAAALAVYIYRKDAIEQEPLRLLLKLAGFGALSCVPAALAELVLSNLIKLAGIPLDSYLGSFLEAFFVAALCEELVKFFFLNRQTWKHPAFDYQFDAIVYAVTLSLGFAALENVEYVLQYGLGTGLLRAVTSVPGHAIFGVFMGYFYGYAKIACSAAPSRGHRAAAAARDLRFLRHDDGVRRSLHARVLPVPRGAVRPRLDAGEPLRAGGPPRRSGDDAALFPRFPPAVAELRGT